MSVRVSENIAAAELNKAVDIGPPDRNVESIVPVSVHAHNQGVANVVLSVKDRDTNALFATDRDTAVAVEDTVYNGDGSTLAFSGEDLDNTPIIPGSVVISDAAAVAPNLIDRDRDGKLYTVDVDDELAGSIDYFTGALILNYPAGKAPGTAAEAINAAYSYQDAVLVPGGKRVYTVDNVMQGAGVVPSVACDSSVGSLVKLEVVSTWNV